MLNKNKKLREGKCENYGRTPIFLAPVLVPVTEAGTGSDFGDSAWNWFRIALVVPVLVGNSVTVGS